MEKLNIIQTCLILERSRHFLSKGCPYKHDLGGQWYEFRYSWYQQAPKTSGYFVQCCNYDGTCLKFPELPMAESCISNTRKTFDEAVQICFEKGGRLCSRNEMNDCCGKTSCDRTQVWVGDELAGNAIQTTKVFFIIMLFC